ncbi:MAG: hypothetical protein U0136_04335 [Bdellovibrionota bacterium]
MIHTVFVDTETALPELRKEVRKKLMTGGAVIRLRPGLSGEDRRRLFNSFLPNARPNSIAAQVLVQLAEAPDAEQALLAELTEVKLKEVSDALLNRTRRAAPKGVTMEQSATDSQR